MTPGLALTLKEAAMNASKDEAVVIDDLQATLAELIDLALDRQAGALERGRAQLPLHPPPARRDRGRRAPELRPSRGAHRHAGRGTGGRPAAVAATSKLPEFPAGHVHVEETVKRIDDAIDTMSARMHERILRVGETDPVSQDALIEASDELEKQAWMLRAQLAAAQHRSGALATCAGRRQATGMHLGPLTPDRWSSHAAHR